MGDDCEFAKKMESLGKEMEQKFGDDSEFARKMETLGKEMEQKFGPGSEFEKKIKEKYGPGSDFEKKIKALGEDIEKKAKEQHKLETAHSERAQAEAGLKKSKPSEARTDAEEHAKTEQPGGKSRTVDQKGRDRRIKALEVRIQELLEELKTLKEADNDHEE